MATKLWDIPHSAIYKPLINNNNPAGLTASVTGPTVDMVNADGPCCLISSIAYVSGSGSPQYDAKLQESADGSTGWADITGASITSITTNATTTPPAGELVGPFQRNQRYVRLVTTIAGTTSPLYTGMISVMSQKKYSPT